MYKEVIFLISITDGVGMELLGTDFLNMLLKLSWHKFKFRALTVVPKETTKK